VVIEADVAVVGAGIAGVSVAYELSARRSVVVLEQEGQAAYHTTGRSAAMFLESYGSPEVRELTAESRAVFDEAGPLLRPRTFLWVAPSPQLSELSHMSKQLPDLEPLTGREAEDQCPPLRAGWCAAALKERNAEEIDVLGLHQHYLGNARRRGARIVLGARVEAADHDGTRWHLTTEAGPVKAEVVVNAAGAWADQVAATLGTEPIGLRPLRRTAAVARADAVDPTWPLVADVGETFYFRPEGANVLLSPADETPSEPCDARPDDLDVALALDRVNEATTLGLRSVVTAWAGLRTFTPDRNPVAGADPAAGGKGLFWLAGQGGYGIQMAPALAKLAAGAVLGEAAVPDALSIERFRS
jgi:D-arginine dehydrogenase